MTTPNDPEKRRRLTEVIRRALRAPGDLPFGKDLPRVGFLPHDSEGILQDILQDTAEYMPAAVLITEPLTNAAHDIIDALEAGSISEAVARARHREWLTSLDEWFYIGGLVEVSQDFDDFVNHQVCEGIESLAYEYDEGGGYLYTMAEQFHAVVSEMPAETPIEEVVAVLARVEPDAFVCLWDYDGIYIYCSPAVEGCAAAEGHAGPVGDILTNGPYATYVLPASIRAAALEAADAAGLLSEG
jgi:hypothetical protein